MADTKPVRLVLPTALAAEFLRRCVERGYRTTEALTEAAAAVVPDGPWLDRVPNMPGPVDVAWPRLPTFLVNNVEDLARRSGIGLSDAWARVVLDWCARVADESARAA